MSDALETFEKILKIFFGEGYKKFTSAIIYFTAGLIGLLAILSVVAPFSASSDLLDSILLKRQLSDADFVLKFSFNMIPVCLISQFIRSCVVYAFTYASNKTIRIVYTHIYSIDDVIDLVTASASLLLVFSVFIQIYHTGVAFTSAKASIVYIWVLYKFVRLIYAYFARQTLKIIDEVNKNYPGLQ